VLATSREAEHTLSKKVARPPRTGCQRGRVHAFRSPSCRAKHTVSTTSGRAAAAGRANGRGGRRRWRRLRRGRARPCTDDLPAPSLHRGDDPYAGGFPGVRRSATLRARTAVTRAAWRP